MDSDNLLKLLKCASIAINDMDTDSSGDEAVVVKLLDLCKKTALKCEKVKKKVKQKRLWVKTWRKKRSEHSSFSFITRELRTNDKTSFLNYLRMSEQTFQLLLGMVSSDITKRNTFMRDAIPPAEKLAATLRFLATGESYMSTNYQTRLSQPFLSRTVPEVCRALWKNLCPIYLKFPSTKPEWERIADEFAIRWQFPNCLGALDGKHIPFRSLRKDGAFYHNYKGSNSIILLALADASCRLIYVDIGCNGRTNDAGVLLQSKLRDVIADANNQFPDSKIVGNGRILPFVIVGDDAFPLQKHLMKPYPFATRCDRKRIYNLRLSRARHVIEHTFGILSNRFRILQTTINMRVENVELVTQACCVLHNFLLHHEQISMATTSNTSMDVPTTSSYYQQQVENPRKGIAEKIRQSFAEYFTQEGQVEWQERQLRN